MKNLPTGTPVGRLLLAGKGLLIFARGNAIIRRGWCIGGRFGTRWGKIENIDWGRRIGIFTCLFAEKWLSKTPAVIWIELVTNLKPDQSTIFRNL